ncbi:hypothetical protein O0I10_002914 [Lichtheimia ornata]|uniref:Uncharacterized protein n=1 Tax=Lichtheimia ornata TaxID=688661 RepID=A0AAD7VBL2_9FUNG|nr:uncharacterized protein O0I10_002914 [Lichtheimia ornata]KAJ8661166.1 hypothetical protein O0I10_002914 [Lichtheimia ornata]
MADDFDDELYNVYNTAKDDAYGNTDIYADYKDALSGDEPQDGSHMDMQGSDPQGQADTAASNMGMMDSSDHNVSGQGAGMQAGSAADDEGGDASGDNNPQQQMLKALQQQQQQQAMMNNWGQFQPNPYQFAMYQQALQQMMMNPYQLQQMMQRQFRQQQPSPTQQPQQQQQQQQQQNVDEGPPSVASAANQDEG